MNFLTYRALEMVMWRSFGVTDMKVSTKALGFNPIASMFNPKLIGFNQACCLTERGILMSSLKKNPN